MARRPSDAGLLRTMGDRLRRWAVGVLAAVAVGAAAPSTVGAASPPVGTPAHGGHRPHDGPGPCSAGFPPAPYAGFCYTYNGANTWYGSYGPGFPVPSGFAWCAANAGAGGDYPYPSYGYVPSGLPLAPGATQANANALGFAFSQVQAVDGWGGRVGVFTRDQEAAAAKLLYDSVFWGTPVPPLDPGTGAAFDELVGWYDQALGAGGQPVITMTLQGGATTVPQSGASLIAHVEG